MDSQTISEFEANCLDVLEQVQRTGRPVLVTRQGQPVALIAPPPPVRVRGESAFGSMSERIVFVGDVVSPLYC